MKQAEPYTRLAGVYDEIVTDPCSSWRVVGIDHIAAADRGY